MHNATTCPACRSRMTRVHRTWLEKAVYREAFGCPRCNTRVGWHYAYLDFARKQFQFVFSRYARCIRCGDQGSVSRLKKRDYIDSFSKNPLARFQRLLGAPVNRCSPCRLQFYDWRPTRPDAQPDPSAPAPKQP